MQGKQGPQNSEESAHKYSIEYSFIHGVENISRAGVEMSKRLEIAGPLRVYLKFRKETIAGPLAP